MPTRCKSVSGYIRAGPAPRQPSRRTAQALCPVGLGHGAQLTRPETTAGHGWAVNSSPEPGSPASQPSSVRPPSRLHSTTLALAPCPESNPSPRSLAAAWGLRVPPRSLGWATGRVTLETAPTTPSLEMSRTQCRDAEQGTLFFVPQFPFYTAASPALVHALRSVAKRCWWGGKYPDPAPWGGKAQPREAQRLPMGQGQEEGVTDPQPQGLVCTGWVQGESQ